MSRAIYKQVLDRADEGESASCIRDTRLMRDKARSCVVTQSNEMSDLSEEDEGLSSADGCGDDALLVAPKLFQHSGNYIRHRPSSSAAGQPPQDVFFEDHTPLPIRDRKHLRAAFTSRRSLIYTEETGNLWRTLVDCAKKHAGVAEDMQESFQLFGHMSEL